MKRRLCTNGYNEGRLERLVVTDNQYTYHNNYELFDIITEEKAGEIKEKYKYVYLEFTPF